MSNEFFRGLRFAIPTSLIMWGVLALVMIALTGCASLVPNYIAPELEHKSHATQHQPFTDHPTGYGGNTASLVVGWQLDKHLNLEIAEGWSLDHHYPQSNQWGEVEGPREQFSARLRYMIEVRK
jgi:hypothetical protein